MKRTNLYKLVYIVLFLYVLGSGLVAPAAGQEPQGEEVSAQAASAEGFLWSPANTSVSRGDGTVITRLEVQGAQQVSGASLSIGYNSRIVSPSKTKPGQAPGSKTAALPAGEVELQGGLLPGVLGIDYVANVTMGGGALACGGDSSFRVDIVYLNPALNINGTGSLVEVGWRSDPDAAVGDVATICLDGETSQLVDNQGFPALSPIRDAFGSITVEPASLFTFQIGLEGEKNSGLVEQAHPASVFTQVTINDLFPCDGGGVDAQGFCAFNNATIPPPYTINVSRPGYLDATATFADPHDSSSIFLLAGDLNDDNGVDILDIQLLAGLLGHSTGPAPDPCPEGCEEQRPEPEGGRSQPDPCPGVCEAQLPASLPSVLLRAADYTGAPAAPGLAPTPDGVINIMDLVLVAKNFGLTGPTEETSSEN
jgi:hypothetical protein